METFETGLRCQDVYAGLRNVDPNSAQITQHLEKTQVVGMAATLAAAIRGEDVIADAGALKVIAADQLDISGFAFPQVIRLLDQHGLVGSVITGSDGEIERFSESVPYHQDLYERMGEAWDTSNQDPVAEAMVHVVHDLATGPLPRDDLQTTLGIAKEETDRVLEIGEASELVKIFPTSDGEIVYSPFHAFEHPDQVVGVFSNHGSDRIREEFERVRAYQGIPVGSDTPVLLDAVGRGLLAAPSVERPDGQTQAFAFLPYSIDREFLTTKKSVLEKATAILACVRCGQHFGGATNIRNPALILNKLARGDSLRAHSSTRRQYDVLWRMRVVEYVQSQHTDRVGVRLIDTDDNKEAIGLAVDLMTYGEKMSDRGREDAARDLLANNGPYMAPMQTIRSRRGKSQLRSEDLRPLIEAMVMGRDRVQ